MVRNRSILAFLYASSTKTGDLSETSTGELVSLPKLLKLVIKSS